MEKLSAGTDGLVPGGSHLLINLSSWYKTSLPPKIECIQQATEQHHTGCGGCADAPCVLWEQTRDPALSEEEFRASIAARLENWKEVPKVGR